MLDSRLEHGFMIQELLLHFHNVYLQWNDLNCYNTRHNAPINCPLELVILKLTIDRPDRSREIRVAPASRCYEGVVEDFCISYFKDSILFRYIWKTKFEMQSSYLYKAGEAVWSAVLKNSS